MVLNYTVNVFTGPPRFPTIRVSEVRLDSFTISWNVIPDVNNVCCPVMYNVTLDNVTNTTSMTNITYSGLNHTTNYTVVVIPYNNAGSGTPANITVTTLIPSSQNMYVVIHNYVHDFVSVSIHTVAVYIIMHQLAILLLFICT